MSDSQAATEALKELFGPVGEERETGGATLAVREVSVGFGGVQALSDITFELEPHEVVAVVGPNGAGKSTLLNAISGLVREQASGGISLNGAEILGHSPSSIAQAGVGRSFQDPPLLDKESVLENVMLGAHLRLRYGLATQVFRPRYVVEAERAIARQADAVLEFAGLSTVRDDRVGQLPYGTRKLVDVLRSLMLAPSLLLLDEPTSGLDPGEQESVSRLLSALHAATPVTVLLIEHHMDVVRTVADRVVTLEAGKIESVGRPEDELEGEPTSRSASQHQPRESDDVEVRRDPEASQ